MSFKFANVENEYKKNKDLKKQDVLALKEWVEKQPHLPEMSELQVIIFLQSCYNSNEAAKRAIDNYFTLRTHCPDLFANRDPEKLTLHLNTVTYSILPKTTKEGHKIFYSKIMDPNTDHYVYNEQIKVYDMTSNIELMTNGTNDGIVILLDMNGSLLGHVPKMHILTAKKFLFYLQEAIPLRIKSIHVMNAQPFTDKLLTLIKPFMKKEFLNNFHIHTKIVSLVKFIPIVALPDEYGGNAGTLKELHDANVRKLLEYRDYFIEDEKLLVDESKRPGKPKNPDEEIFGVQGSFKTLSID